MEIYGSVWFPSVVPMLRPLPVTQAQARASTPPVSISSGAGGASGADSNCCRTGGGGGDGGGEAATSPPSPTTPSAGGAAEATAVSDGTCTSRWHVAVASVSWHVAVMRRATALPSSSVGAVTSALVTRRMTASVQRGTRRNYTGADAVGTWLEEEITDLRLLTCPMRHGAANMGLLARAASPTGATRLPVLCLAVC